MRRLLLSFLTAALATTGLAGLAVQHAAPAGAAAGIRVSLIGDKPLTSLIDASQATRGIITGSFPVSNIDGADCRGTGRTSCFATPPARGLPASALDVVRSMSGDLGDVVVLVTGYSDQVFSPTLPVPDVTPFVQDFEAVMNALQAEASVQHVLMLNLRTEDPRIPNVPNNNQRNKYIAINARLGVNESGGFDADPRYPKLHVRDWNNLSASLNCGGNDEGCFRADDGITPRNTPGNLGAPTFATFIRDRILEFPGAATGAGTPLPVGDRCAAGNHAGFAPYANAQVAPQIPEVGKFKSVDPTRLIDTRAGDADGYNRVNGGQRLHRVRVVGDDLADGVPPSATAVSLNVTVANGCGFGFVTVFPCGPTGIPTASNLNFTPGQVVPNAVTVRVGVLGRVCVFSNVATDIIVDLNGYYDSKEGAVGVAGHAAASPVRVVDTRTPPTGSPSLDPFKGKVGPNASRLVNLVGLGAVPADASGVVLNVTATEPEGFGFLTVFPAVGGNCNNRPNASNVNYAPGQNVSNYVAARVSGTGQICVYTPARTHLVIDRVASFSPTAGNTNIFPIQPRRVLDTRANEPAALGIKGRLQPFVPLEVPIGAANVGLPGSAQAAILNITGVQPSAGAFLSVWPCGPWPGTSNLNLAPGEVRPNQVDATLAAGGRVCLLSNTSIDVVVDLMGWYQT